MRLPTVLKARKRHTESGLELAPGELPRLGSKPKLDEKQAAMVTAIACSEQRLWNLASPILTATKACVSC